jgi:IS30 family transposase
MAHKHLTADQRSQIYALLSKNFSQKEIATHLGVDKSCVSREIKRNSGLKGYRPKQADEKAQQRRTTASSRSIHKIPAVMAYVEEKLSEKWSPEQISGVLKANKISFCTEMIYRHIRADRAAGGVIYKNLRHAGKKYKNRVASEAGRKHIPNRVDISKRPAVVETKQRLGDWEGDLIVGAKHQGFILTLVDRKSKYILMALLSDKTAESTIQGVNECFKRLPRYIVHTITFDNGKEFSGHEKITKKFGASCYFAKPYHSNDRGINEHHNGLVRQTFPKGTDFLKLTKREVLACENELNNRPRKILNYCTPKQVLFGYRKPQQVELDT